MGVVIPFPPLRQRRLGAEEEGLLRLFQGRVHFMWAGGWAVAGEPDGVAVLRNQHCIGVWSFGQRRFSFVSIETGRVTRTASGAEGAYQMTLELLGVDHAAADT